ncbi:hypothetical protein C3747_57g153 [Trypanosoma cruzi]|uniref:Uncharacterized protein n=1 Tax=Trypanosoma cruzi TaxID=5693 RepID=A0A2V2WT21_TRYCR|nr:hypothetical protein TcYC6_0127160 [Trypanosoma cruzi]PWV11768.1 hypothetical protein C3747_57g153 [Trypanosoma cruzi]
MRSFLVGCVHSALHHGVEATAPCPDSIYLHSLEVRHRDSCTASLGPRASTKDTSAHLEANLAPLRRIVGFLEPTQHERLTFLWYIEEERGAICSETMPQSIHRNAVTSIPLPRDAVLDGMRRVRSHMGIFPHHTRASHAEHRIFVRDTVSRDGVGIFQPRHAQDAPDGVRRSAVEAARTFLGPLHCQLTPRTAELPVGPHRTAAGSLACSCRAECPATEHGLRHFPVPRLAAASQSPTRVPVATDSLSAMESLRLGPLEVHDDVGEEICAVPLSQAARGRTVGSVFSP